MIASLAADCVLFFILLDCNFICGFYAAVFTGGFYAAAFNGLSIHPTVLYALVHSSHDKIGFRCKPVPPDSIPSLFQSPWPSTDLP